MKKRNRLLTHFFQVLVIVLLLVNSAQVYSIGAKPIVLVTSKTGGAYQTFVDSFSETYLKEAKNESPLDIKVVPVSQLSTDKKDWKHDDTIIVTIGTKAAIFLAGLELKLPVIHAMLPFSVYKKIEGNAGSCAMQTAIYIDQPIGRQIELSKLIFPARHRYGFILGDVSSKRYKIEKELLRLSSRNIFTSFIEESRELAWSLRDLSVNVDAFIALNDPLVFNPNNAKWLLYMAYQENKPVIGFSKPYVSAGASTAVYSTPSQLGRQTAEQTVKYQRSKNSCLFKPQYPQYFSVAINKAVVESLSGRVLSEEALRNRLLQLEKKNK